MESDLDKCALPKFDSPRIRKLRWTPASDRYRAYNTILEAEAYARQQVVSANAIKPLKDQRPVLRQSTEKLISARVAGYLFIEFEAHSDLFNITPGETLIKWILSDPRDPEDNQHDVVINNGRNLRDNFIRPFRTSNIRYPPPSSHPSRPSFDNLREMIKDSMEATSDSYGTSRKRALARDGYRCIVTGIYDETSLENCPELGDVRKVQSATLEIAHIFNESTVQGIDPRIAEESKGSGVYNKTYHTATAMSILRSFGFSEFADNFEQVGGVHQVWNLMALERNLHSRFDKLKMWFEPTETLHRYRVCTFYVPHMEFIHNIFAGRDRRVEGAPEFVEFNSHIKEAPAPQPLLLALHGLCARVAHMSGAAEFFDRLEWDAEETRTLAFDGSSGILLDHLLSPFATTIPAVA